MNLLTVDHITKVYTQRELFHDASFYLQDGEKVMKKLIFLFLCLYNLAFGIIDFPDINWGDNKSRLELIFPKLEKEISIDPSVEVFSFPKPNEGISKYSFYFVNDQLFKVEILFNKDVVGRDEVKQIYLDTVKKMGKNVDTKPINEKYGDITLTGNSMKFVPDIYTFVFLKGVDTLDKDKNMIDSQLILEYVNSTTFIKK